MTKAVSILILLKNKYYLNIFLFPNKETNKFKAEFVFSVRTGPELIKSPQQHDINAHSWLSSAASCDFTGKFKFYKDYKRKKTDLSGKGYHDHHWGNEALFGKIEQWYWGRLHSNEYTIVFHSIEYKDGIKPFRKILLYKNDRLICEKDDFEMKVKKSHNYILLNYNNFVTIKFDDYTLVNRSDVKIENGSFYMRFLSKHDFYVNEKLVLDNVTGISDYLYPKRMNSGFFRKFSKTPIAATEED